MLKVIIFISVFIFSIGQTFAKTSVDVEIYSETKSSSNSNINTNIKVETNGKVTTYSSDKSEDIEINSTNGESEIKVNGSKVDDNTNQLNSNPKPNNKPENKKRNKMEIENILDVFEDLFKKLFSLFG